MKILLKLKLFDWMLVVFTVLVLALSVRLESASNKESISEIIHMASAMSFLLLVFVVEYQKKRILFLSPSKKPKSFVR